MNLLKITLLLLSVSLLYNGHIYGQENLSVTVRNMIYSQQTLLTFHGLDLNNKGDFYQDSSTLLFTSMPGGGDLYLKSGKALSIHNLDLRIGNNSLILEDDVQIENRMKLIDGNLNLNSQTLSLGEEGEILGEGGENQILGQGVIEKRANLNFPYQSSPGNIGLSISAEDNLGLTVLKRIQALSEGDSLVLIHRQYEIASSFTPNNPLNLSFDYLDTENPFAKEAMLTPLAQQGATWNRLAYYQPDTKSNTIHVLLPEAKKAWHIGFSHAESVETKLSPEKKSDLQVFPNPFTSYIFLQWEEEDETPIQVQLFTSGGALIYTKVLDIPGQEILIGEIPDLPEGMYIVKVQTDKGSTFSKSISHTNQ